MCRTTLIRSALESTDPGASNGGSNVGNTTAGAGVTIFEMTRLAYNGFEIGKIVDKKIVLFGNSAVSNVVKSTLSRRPSASEPPFDAPGSVFSSAL